jgi:hypothetical protein
MLQLKQIPPIGNRPIGRHDVRGSRRPLPKMLKYRFRVGRTVDIALDNPIVESTVHGLVDCALVRSLTRSS